MSTNFLKITIAETEEEFNEGKKLFLEYAGTLGFSLCFQNFEGELANIASLYAKPKGILLLLQDANQEYLGCVGIKKFDNFAGEMKRLYIKEHLRGKGLGRILMENVLSHAKQLGYHKVVLDTLPTMQDAIKNYEKAGFVKIAPYYQNPVEGAIFYEKGLD